MLPLEIFEYLPKYFVGFPESKSLAEVLKIYDVNRCLLTFYVILL